MQLRQTRCSSFWYFRETDVFAFLMYNLELWKRNTLQQLWVVHESFEIPVEVVRLLPASHALSGRYTANKVGTKKYTFYGTDKKEYQTLQFFATHYLDDKMVNVTELLLPD